MALTERLAVLVTAAGGGAISEFKKIGSEAKKAHDQIAKSQKDAEQSSGRLGKALQSLGVSSTQALGAGLAAGATSAAVALGKFGRESVDAFAEFGSSVRRIQAVTGQSAEDASRLAVAFKFLGVDAQTATTVLSRLGKNIFENEKGLTQLGVTVARDQHGRVDLHGTLLNIADAYKRTADPAQRAELAFKAFGRGAQAILPVLARGADGLRQIEHEADRFGLVLGQKGVDAAKKFAISQKELGLAVEGFKVNVGEKLAPSATDLATGLTKVGSGADHAVQHLGGLNNWLLALVPPLGAFAKVGHEGASSQHALAEAALEADTALSHEIDTASHQVTLLQGTQRAALGVEQAHHNLAEAQKKLNEAEHGGVQAARDARAAADARKSAEQGVESALRSQTHAQEELTKAQKAYDEAVHADHSQDLVHAAFDVREAQFAQTDAQTGLSDAINEHGSGSLEAAKAQLTLEEATQRLTEAQGEAGNIQKEADEKVQSAHEALISASEQLAAANDQVSTAQDRLNNAGRDAIREAPDVVGARLAVRSATLDLQSAIAAGADAQGELDTLLQGMNGDKAASTLAQMQPLLDALRLDGQNPDDLPLVKALEAVVGTDLIDQVHAHQASQGKKSGPKLGPPLPAPNLLGGGFPAIPGFASGGVMPGAIGAPGLAVLHGGERIIPNGGGSSGVQIGSLNVYAPTSNADDIVDAVHAALIRKRRRSGALGLN